MKAVPYVKPGISLVDLPEPIENLLTYHGDDYVKIKPAYAGICGTDAHIAAGHFDPMVPATPFPLGHETSGVVVELGPKAKVKGLEVGDRVAYYFNNHCGKCHFCRNGQEHLCTNIQFNMSSMCEYITVAEQQVYKLPDGISLLQGALTEPVSFCMHTVDVGGVKSGSTVVISGGGAIGLMTLQLAKLAGGFKITVIEPVEEKRKIALELGASYVIDPVSEDVADRIAEITDCRGYDVVFECSGAKSTIQASLTYASAGGTVVYVAMYGDASVSVNLWDLFQRELKVTAPHQSPYVWERTINVLPDLNLDIFTQCVFTIEKCAEAFEAQRTSKYTKVIIQIDPNAGE